MLFLSDTLSIHEGEIVYSAIRSGGPGGQHVNKVATAIQLKFDVPASSLPDEVKDRLLSIKDSRISKDGIITIKAQSSRSQLKNREDATTRLIELIQKAASPKKKRKSTYPSKLAKEKRLKEKKQRGEIKTTRKKLDLEG